MTRDFNATPWERVKIGNGIAHDAAKDGQMRAYAAAILKDCPRIDQLGAQWIARWIRKNCTYQQEAPGVEILQGPYDSLKYRVVDCDDAAILWTTLTRTAGIRGHMAGVGKISTPDRFFHAVGYNEDDGKHYELSVDRRYGGNGWKGLYFTVKPQWATVVHDPSRDTFLRNVGGAGYRKVGE